MNPIVSRMLGWDNKNDEQRSLVKYRVGSLIASLIAFLPMRLWVLLSYFNSDKHADKHHHYGFTDDELFRPFKYRRVKLLEIGIGGAKGAYGSLIGGSSLLAWKAFFPFGTIVGCDIRPKAELTTMRTRIYEIDQSSQDQLAALQRDEGPFDIIIDDGSHMNVHQIFTFEHMLDTVIDGGLYIIEDVQTSYWPIEAFGTRWDGVSIGHSDFCRTCVGYFTELAKYLNHAEFVESHGVEPKLVEFAKKIQRIAFEHNMIVIRKGKNDEPSNWVDLIRGPSDAKSR
jgi:hypothetical protein